MAYVDYAEQDIRTERVPYISRKDFIRLFGREWRPGQHVTFLGPSGRGKTKLMFQLLTAVIHHNDKITVYILHGKIKGRDQTINEYSRRTGMPVSTRFPVRGFKRYKARKAQGFILRPLSKPGESPDDENKKLHAEYRKAIHSGYQAKHNKPVIIVADEAHQAHNDLKLMRDCEGPLMRGRPVCSMWSLLQRGRYVSYHVYDQAEWVFMFYDPDRNNQQRYSEIGDVDPRELIELTRQLHTKTVADGSTISEALCFRRSGNQLMIVGL